MNNKNRLICIGLFTLFAISFGYSKNEPVTGKKTKSSSEQVVRDSTGRNEMDSFRNEIKEKEGIISEKDTTIKKLNVIIKQLQSKYQNEEGENKNKETSEKSSTDWKDVLAGLVLVVILFLAEKRYKIVHKIKDYFNDVEELEQVKTIDFDVSKINQAKGIAVEDANNLKPTEKSDKALPFNKKNTNSTWLVVGQSVMEKSHIENNIPCQDNHFIEDLGNNWGIAISCDGAGSAKNSQVGSKFVSEHAAKVFRAIVEQSNFLKQDRLPTKTVWQDLAKRGLYQTYQDLEVYSKKEGFRIESLACTAIVVIYSPLGYLVTHIGDGRAGYLNEQNEWKSLMTPWKGEEANQTVFITSSIWNEKIDNFIESDVIETEPRAFTLMSDGCENHSFECSKMNPVTKEWSDPNLPFPKFFNPLMGYLAKSKKDGKSNDEINTEWSKFISEGTPGLKNESDDKTLILGILQSIE